MPPSRQLAKPAIPSGLKYGKRHTMKAHATPVQTIIVTAFRVVSSATVVKRYQLSRHKFILLRPQIPFYKLIGNDGLMAVFQRNALGHTVRNRAYFSAYHTTKHLFLLTALRPFPCMTALVSHLRNTTERLVLYIYWHKKCVEPL